MNERSAIRMGWAMALAAAVAGGAVTGSANAAVQNLMGVATDGKIYSLSPLGGAATLLGTNTGSAFHAISLSPGGTYYANDWGNSFQFLSLTIINRPTGTKGADQYTGTLLFQDWAFSPSGVLYGLEDDSGADWFDTIDIATGMVTQIARLNAYSGGMAFVGSTLYASDVSAGLVTINTTTGVRTDVNAAQGGGWTGMTSANGLLYGTDGSNLYTINTSTGVQTLVGATGVSGLHGLTPLTVPEPAGLGLLGLAGVGLLGSSRRR